MSDTVVLWSGVGLGIANTRVGLSSLTAGSLTANIQSSVYSFILSPRVGADLRISKAFWIGGEAFYMSTSATVSGTITNSSNSASADFNETASRSWWGLAARLGFAL